MNQKSRLEFLVKKFKEDSIRYKNLEVEEDYDSMRKALRSLMNIRFPKDIEEEVVKVQNEFLQEEAAERGILELGEIPTIGRQYKSRHPFKEKISIWKGDITRLKLDAIVNAANSRMLGCFIPCHRCIDNAIHSAAGIELRQECNEIMEKKRSLFGPDYEEPTGQAMITKGYNLPAKYVLHTVGPIVRGPLNEGLKKDLENCYKSVLTACLKNQIRTIAFCCISTGEFHFPNEEAAKIAVKTVEKFLEIYESSFERVIFNVFKEEDFRLYEEELGCDK